MKPSATCTFLPVMLSPPHWWPADQYKLWVVDSTGFLQVLDVVSYSLKYVCLLKLLLGVLHREYSTSGTALDSNFVMGRWVSNCSEVGFQRPVVASSAMVEIQERQTDFKWHGLLSRRRKRSRSR